MKKILIVDDEPNIVMALEFSLKKKGFEVLIARDGEEAIHVFDANHPKVVVLDVMMPKLDGFEVLKHINSNYPESKVIFLSAKSKKEDIQKGLDEGAEKYFTKPFSTKKLLAEIENLYA
jgi:DNA-binding response OmpR family regulator